MALMTDVMVDVETTGTSPDYAAIIQIAAVKFNYETGEIGGIFNRCLTIPPGRFWDESTRTWWLGQKRSVFEDIMARGEDPQAVMNDLCAYLSTDAPYGGLRFWAKPVHFDFTFIASYFRQFGLPNPCHFRIARDLNTYIAAMRGGVEHVDLNHIEFVGDAHNALADTIHQVKMLFAAKRGDWGDDVVEATFHEVAK